MRNTRHGMAVGVASALMALVGVGPASAATWDPPNTTLTAHGILTIDLIPSNSSVTCTYHSGVRSAGGVDAFTTLPSTSTPAGPSFSGCTTNVPPANVVFVVSSSPWTLTATNTTAVDVTNGNFVITLAAPFLGHCTITTSSMSVGATWSNATRSLTPSTQTFPISESGFICPGDTSARWTGSVTIQGGSIT